MSESKKVVLEMERLQSSPVGCTLIYLSLKVRVLFDYVDVDGDGSLNLSVPWTM